MPSRRCSAVAAAFRLRELGFDGEAAAMTRLALRSPDRADRESLEAALLMTSDAFDLARSGAVEPEVIEERGTGSPARAADSWRMTPCMTGV
jgi:hypothetical protein